MVKGMEIYIFIYILFIERMRRMKKRERESEIWESFRTGDGEGSTGG